MKLRILSSVIIIVILAGVISACGSETSETSTGINNAQVPDPCQLLTKADAEAILGEPVAPGELSEADNTKSCSYLSTGAAPRMANVIIVKPCSMGDYMNYAEGPLAEPIEGIGMHASWDKATLLVHSKSGDTCVYASGGGNPPGTDPLDDKPALEQAKKVANKVLERLDAESNS